MDPISRFPIIAQWPTSLHSVLAISERDFPPEDQGSGLVPLAGFTYLSLECLRHPETSKSTLFLGGRVRLLMETLLKLPVCQAR